MNITISSPMLKMINDLYATGLWGESMEDTARRLIEIQLREQSALASRADKGGAT